MKKSDTGSETREPHKQDNRYKKIKRKERKEKKETNQGKTIGERVRVNELQAGEEMKVKKEGGGNHHF